MEVLFFNGEDEFRAISFHDADTSTNGVDIYSYPEGDFIISIPGEEIPDNDDYEDNDEYNVEFEAFALRVSAIIDQGTEY